MVAVVHDASNFKIVRSMTTLKAVSSEVSVKHPSEASVLTSTAQGEKR